ncbi:MAG: lipid A biosynthesis lauroyl acyltransferase [Xanthobacteraceae bacterium]|nr:lipid A biosynthesis lauroyl acyltransferase [Xanthobacteraceae bacterium]
MHHWRFHLRARVLRALGRLAVVMMRLLRRTDRKRLANFFAAAMRRIGPRLREQEIARANLAAAFPEKSPQEIDTILTGSWDNLGRVTAEFVHLDRFTILDMEKPGDVDVTYDPVTVDRMVAILNGGARLFFGTHLGNWELPARFAHYYGLDSTVLFRAPNIRPIADAVVEMRAGCMGTLVPSGFDAPMRMLRALERGGKVGMLVDQHDSRGVDITFFGRACKASPLIAQLARHMNCPIHGVRVVRLADRNKFWAEITDPIEPVRDPDGKINVAGTTQAIANVIETWVREHPDQWLWQHRRWR